MPVRPMNRRRFLISAASSGAALAGAGALAAPAAAATDDELAFANFGAAAELLLKDFYVKTREAKLFGGQLDKAFARGQFAAGEHVTALSAVLTDSAQTAPLAEDFEFAWPEDTFKTRKAAASAGLTVVEALLGAYLTAAATSPTLSLRVLFASLAANLGEQLSTLSLARGRPAIGNSFPVAFDLEAASLAVEAFLG
jgi:hypothetical protein